MLPYSFETELQLIRERHGRFFPEKQLSYITIEHVDGIPQLKFLEDYDLSSIITMEIELAFKFIYPPHLP